MKRVKTILFLVLLFGTVAFLANTVEKRVHSIAVDQATHKVYTSEEEEGGIAVAKMVAYSAVTERQ
jgi:hypothetical protein